MNMRVDDVTLRKYKTLKKSVHEYIAYIGYFNVIFKPVLGYKSKKPIRWRAFYLDPNSNTCLGEANTLKETVRQASQHLEPDNRQIRENKNLSREMVFSNSLEDEESLEYFNRYIAGDR